MCKLPTKSFLFGDTKIEAPESQIMVLVPRNFNRLAQNYAGAYCPKYCTIGIVAVFTRAIRAVVVVVAVAEYQKRFYRYFIQTPFVISATAHIC
jgi:hypothetical protein